MKISKKLNDYQRVEETPAVNGRFGASGAVARPKVCANLEALQIVKLSK